MAEASVLSNSRARAWKRVQKYVSGGAAAALLAGMLVVAGVGVQSALAAEPAPDVTVAPASAPVLGEDVTLDVTIANPAGSAAVYNLSATLLLPDTVSIVSAGALGTPSAVYPAGAVLPGTMAGGADTCAALGLVNPNPAQAGKCAVPAGKQFAVFQNFSDLPATGDVSTSVVLRPKVNTTDTGGVASGYAVGDALEITMNAYTSSNERFIPVFPGSTGIGGAQAGSATSNSSPKSIDPKMRALRVEKSEPSPEGELLRGVHGERTTVYTLTVHHTGEGDLSDATVVDYLPAALEYLGSCTGGDNTTDAGNGATVAAEEWEGSGPMVTGGVGANCLDATSVETVQGTLDANGQFTAGASGSVYTKVTWNLGALLGSAGTKQALPSTPGAPGTTTIRYRAGVPLFENTMDFGGSTPTAASGTQGANLDNNRGASTRQGIVDGTATNGAKEARTLTNVAIGGGNWRGVTNTLAPVWSEDRGATSVHVSDVRVLKSVRIGNTAGWSKQASFVQGDIADYRLQIATSEYVGASVDGTAIRVTDTFANGLCPVYPAGVAQPEFLLGSPATTATLAEWNAALNAAGLSECQWSAANNNAAAKLSGATLVSVAFDSTTGRFAQQFALDAANSAAFAEPNAAIEVIYTARQNQSYVTDGATSSGDTVVNAVEVEAKTTPRTETDGLENAGGAVVDGDYFTWDDSHARVVTNFSDTQKSVLRNTPEFGSLNADGVVALDYGSGAVTDPTDAAYPWTGKEAKPFGIGDQVWFKIHWDTARGAEVRNPVLTDFLPQGVTFDPVGLDAVNEWGASSNLRVVASRNGAPITVSAGSPLEITPECSYTDPATAFGEFVGKVALSDSNSRLTWELGSDNCHTNTSPSASSDRFWPDGIDLDFYIKVTVSDAQAFGKTDLSQNLAKYQQENVDGEIFFQRRQAEIVPDMSPRLVKGIASVGTDSYGVNSNVDMGDRGPVVQADALKFRLDVTSPASVTTGYQIWDALPEGIKAEDLAGYNPSTDAITANAEIWDAAGATTTNGFTARAYNPGDTDFASWGQINPGYSGRSIVVWTVTAPVPGTTPATETDAAIQRGISLFYTINVPSGATASTPALIAQQFTNTASIAQFNVQNAGGGSSTVIANVPTAGPTTQVPTGGSSEGVEKPKPNETALSVSTRTANSVPGSYPIDAGFMTDPSGFELPEPSIAKALRSTEIGPNPSPAAPFGENQIGTNNGDGQVVQGEFATFDYKVTIPAYTSVPAGAVLADRGYLTLGSKTGTQVSYTVDASGTTVDLPSGATAANFTFDSATGKLTFNDRFDAGNENRVFTVHLRARVANASANLLSHGNTLYNVATFTYNNGQGAAKVVDASATEQYVDPLPTLTKAVSGTPGANGTVAFTLTAGNTSGRPTLFDSVVYDCLPAGFTIPAPNFNVSAGTVTVSANPCSVTGTGANVRVNPNDPTGTGTLIVWNVGPIDAGTQRTLVFDAVIDQNAAGGASYTNSAQIIGRTLPDTLSDASDRRGDRTTGAQRNVPIAAATQDKSVSPTSAPVGETVTYTLTTTIPANANYYFVDLKDQLPRGVEFVTGSAQVVNDGGLTINPAPSVAPIASGAYGQQLNWAINSGTITTSSFARQIVITYQAKIRDTVVSATPTNLATFSWNTSSTNNDPANRLSDDGTASVTILNPNLGITKDVRFNDAQGTTGWGQEATGNPDRGLEYRLIVSNSGTSAAHHSVVVDSLPAGVVNPTAFTVNGVAIASPNTAVYNSANRTVTWTLPGTIVNGGSVTLGYTAGFAPSSTLTSAADGLGVTQTNQASVTRYESFGSDGRVYTPGQNGQAAVTDTADATPQFPRVTLAKAAVDTTKTAYVGEPFAWRLTATNTGLGSAQKVVLTDTLPENWEFTAVTSITVGGVAQPLTNPSGGPNGPLVWTFGADAVAGVPAPLLAQNQSIVITYTATPKNPEALTVPGVGSSTPHVNTLSAVTTDRTNATANQSGSHTGANATDSAFLRVADLKLVKQAKGGTTGTAPANHPLAGVPANQWVIGQAVETGVYTQPQWEITVTNHGPDDSYGPFAITDTPATPAGVTVGSWTATYVAPNGTETALGIFSGTSFSVGGNTTRLLANGSDKIVLRANVTVGTSAAPGDTVSNEANVLGRTYEAPGTQGPSATNPNTDDDSRVLIESADLQVVKAVSATPNAGGAISWTITPSNNGPSVSRNTAANPVTITDTIPAGVNGVADPSTAMWAATVPGGFPANAGATITFTLKPSYASLPVGAHAAITLSGIVDPAWTPTSGPQNDGSIRNTAVIVPGQGLTPDPKTPNNTSTVPTTPTFNTTLGVSKDRVVKQGDAWVLAASLNPVPQVHAGDPVHYLVTVTNNGAAVARGVTVVDEVPAGLTYSSVENVSPATWSRSVHANGTWDQFSLTSDSSTLPVGAARSFVVEYGTNASTPADVSNCVQAGSSDNSSQPRDCEGFTSDRLSDLSLEKSVISAPGGDVQPDGTVVLAGKVVTYRLTVTNQGPSDALGAISVTDTLPANFSYVAGSATVSGTGAEPTVSGQDLTWEVLPVGGTLPVASGSNTITIELQATVASTHGAATGIVNEATVAGQNDPNPANDTDDATVNIETLAEMSIVKTVEEGPWLAGTEVSYTLTVTNSGPSAAPTARVADTLPSGLTMVSMTGNDWNCVAVPGAQTGVCNYDGAHPVGTSTITVVAKLASNLPSASQPNPFTNVADLGWTDSRSYPDPADDPRHDSGNADITVTTQADLGLVKTAVDPADDTTEVTSAVAGEQARYRLDVTNYGPSDAAPDLVVTDTLPLGVAYVGPAGATASNWNIEVSDYDPAVPQVVTFTRVAGATNVGLPMIGTDPTGAPAILFDVLLSSELAATSLPDVPALLNTATVTSGTAEPAVDPHPNTDDAALNIVRSADLEITKSHPVSDDRDRVIVGEALPFTIDVTNHGPSVSSGFTITDTMPVGFEVTSAVGPVLDDGGNPTGWEIVSISPTPYDETQTTKVVATYTGVTEVGASVPPLVIDTLVHEQAFSETDGVADEVINHVEITNANEPDPVDPNNEFDDPILVQPVVTLVIEKTAVGEFKVGKAGIYSITVENLGPHPDLGPITVTDQLPAGLSFRESPKLPEGATVTHENGLVTWTLTKPLGVGEKVELSLVVNVGQAAHDQPNHEITNTAVVDSESQLTDESVLTDDAVVKVKPVDPLVVTGGDLAGGLLAAIAMLVLLGGGVYIAGRRRQRARHA